MKGRRKAGVFLCSILCLMIFLTAGCSRVTVPETLTQSALSVSANGEVTAYLVEVFDKDYYQLAELEAMVKEELAEFNESRKAESGESVKMVSLGMLPDDSKCVALQLWFSDVQAYVDYTGKTLFYGTVEQAHAKGLGPDVKLASVKDGSVIGKTEIYENGTKKILIVQDRVLVYGPGKPMYVNTQATVNEDGSVALTADTEEKIYIIMK